MGHQQRRNTNKGKTFPNKEKHQTRRNLSTRRNTNKETPNKGKPFQTRKNTNKETPFEQGETFPDKGKPFLSFIIIPLKFQTRENTKQGNTNKGNAFRARGIFRSDVKVVVGVFRQGKAVVSDVWVWCYWWWMFISMG
jgi:hypothetical protein